jgi:hypothetical protein
LCEHYGLVPRTIGINCPNENGEVELRVEAYERELKLYSGRELLLSLPRHYGDRGVVLDYRPYSLIKPLLRSLTQKRASRHLINHPMRRNGTTVVAAAELNVILM